MSLIKLLTVSKSFVNGRNQSGRYRMVESVSLPKFAPVGRPVSLAPLAKAGELPLTDVMVAQCRADARAVTPVPVTTSGSRPSPLSFAPSPQEAGCANAVPTSTNFFRLRKNPFTTRSIEDHSSQPSEQKELSLDSIKVVRNDLSDADFDVVAARTKPESEGGVSQRPRFLRPEAGGFAWSRLIARFFNSERARV